MKCVVQRVSRARVWVEEGAGAPGGGHDQSIARGLMALVGVERGDDPGAADWLADKLANLRIFEDDAGKMNRSVLDLQPRGQVMIVSQFTLAGDARKGNRPSFVNAEAPDLAAPIVEQVATRLEEKHGIVVARGVFGASMRIELVNEGPVTIIL
jgi:D-tyrosyl-tRNA(Tyr) deacylase